MSHDRGLRLQNALAASEVIEQLLADQWGEKP
jgi:hypothetical protein